MHMAERVSHDDTSVWQLPNSDPQAGPTGLHYVAGLDISTDDGKVDKSDG